MNVFNESIRHLNRKIKHVSSIICMLVASFQYFDQVCSPIIRENRMNLYYNVSTASMSETIQGIFFLFPLLVGVVFYVRATTNWGKLRFHSVFP